MPEFALSRPFVDSSICGGVWAGEGEFSDSAPWNPYAVGTTAPVWIEVIADPGRGPTGPFAVLVLYADRPLSTVDRVVSEVAGRGVAELFGGDGQGNGGVFWDLPTGGQAYLRTRNLDHDAARDIVAALDTRESTVGYELDAERLDVPFEVVAEGTNEGLDGRVSGFTCVTPTNQYSYRLQALQGDPIWEYLAISDRPPPIEVGYVQGTLVAIGGLADAAAPTIADLVNADEATWAWMLGASPGPSP